MITLDYEHLSTGNLPQEFMELINQQKQAIEDFEGNWYSYDDVIVSYYVAENIITSLHQAYATLYISEPVEEDIFLYILTATYELAKADNMEIIYIEVISNNSVLERCDDWIKEKRFDYLTTVVQKDLFSGCSPSVNVGGFARMATPSDFPFLINCLTSAYKAGIPNEINKRLNDNRLRDVVRYYYSTIAENCLFLIFEADGQPKAHATFKIPELKSGYKFSEVTLVDVYVLPGYQNQGISHYLCYIGENECLKKGYKRVIGTVETSSNKHVYHHLIRNGWNIRSKIFWAQV